VAETESLGRCRLTLGRFERALSRTSLARIDRSLFALRPVFEQRYGLRPLGAGPLKTKGIFEYRGGDSRFKRAALAKAWGGD